MPTRGYIGFITSRLIEELRGIGAIGAKPPREKAA
jgi:hypothetical protein